MTDSFPEQLAQAMDEADLLRGALALRLGCKVEAVNAWLNGVRYPGLMNRHKLKNVLGLDVPPPDVPERPLRGRKAQTTVYLDRELFEGLREASKDNNVPMARLIRDAVRDYLRELEDSHGQA